MAKKKDKAKKTKKVKKQKPAETPVNEAKDTEVDPEVEQEGTEE